MFYPRVRGPSLFIKLTSAAAWAYEAGAALGEPPPAAARQEAVNAIRQARQKRHDLPHDDCAFYDGGDIWAAELKGFDRAIAAVEALGEGASERDGSRNERT